MKNDMYYIDDAVQALYLMIERENVEVDAAFRLAIAYAVQMMREDVITGDFDAPETGDQADWLIGGVCAGAKAMFEVLRVMGAVASGAVTSDG